MRLLGLGASLAVVLTVGVACKSTPSGNGNGCASTGADVTISTGSGTSFNPASVTVSTGQKVCWENGSGTAHTVTADPTASDTTWKLDEQLNPNFVVVYTFTKVGVDYPYHCVYHQASGMTGVIKVR
jgi:plastocyanin